MKRKNPDQITFRQALPLFTASIKRVWELDKGYVILTCGVFLFGIIPDIAVAVTAALFNQRLVLGAGKIAGYFNAYSPLIIALIVTIIDDILFSVWRWTETKSIDKITGFLLKESAKKAEKIDYASYDDPEFYDRIKKGWSQDGQVFVHSVTSIFNCVKYMVGSLAYISVLAYVDWKLMLFITAIRILVNPLINKTYIMTYRLDNKLAELRRKESYYRGFFQNRGMSAEGKLFSLYGYAEVNYLAAHNEIYKATFIHKIKVNVVQLISNVIYRFPLIVGYIYLSLCVYNGSVSLANMTLFITMYTGFVDQIYNTISNLSNFRGFSENTRFAREFLSLPTSIYTDDDAKKAKPQTGGHTITFDRVSFRYPGTERYVLDNVSFSVGANETVSIIGANGAGKTTLIQLLMRLYEPTSGNILLDGRDIKTYSVKALNELFGVLFQDYCSYPMSAVESITLSTEKPHPERLSAALRDSTAGEIIENLTDKLDTPLSRRFYENGAELSVGQKQRVALARAYYRDAPIMILDEPSASIDPKSEAEMLDAVEKMHGKKNIFIISHRLSTCVFSDRILLIENGRLIGNGTHRELIVENAEYKRLFNLQASKYENKLSC